MCINIKDTTELEQILVFKTNIRTQYDVNSIKPVLDAIPQILRWNIDTEDIDRVLRIESGGLTVSDIIQLINKAGYDCEDLWDQ